MGMLLSLTCLLLVQTALRSAERRSHNSYLRELWRVEASSSNGITAKSRMVARSDGSFWLTLPGRCQFVLVQPNGRMSEPEGGCGTAAGQFRDISSAGRYYDTLWIWDRAVGRLTLFTGGDPQPRRMLRLDFSRTSFRGSAVPLVAALLEGHVVLAHQPAQPSVFGQNDTLASVERLMMLSLDGRGALNELTLDAASQHARHPAE
jgi:hypothetical protein